MRHRADCGSKTSFAKGKYWWITEARFGAKQYCRELQLAFRQLVFRLCAPKAAA
jgi:hypothetical protein